MKDNTALYNFLREGTVCLTATNRLARQIMVQFDEFMIAAAAGAWKRPSVYALDNWCRRLSNSLNGESRFLNSAQSGHLWERIIRHDIETTQHELLQITSTARKAAQASVLLHDYDAELKTKGITEDHQAFYRWHKAWNLELGRLNRQDQSTRISFVSKAFAQGELSPPAKIVMVGFDDFNPAQKNLLHALAEAGTQTEIYPDNQIESDISVYPGLDREDEVAECARWIRHLLRDNPELRIGVIAPDLERYQSLIRHHFLSELDPSAALDGSGSSLPYNISLGGRLDGEGVIFSALQLLSLPSVLSIDELSRLLLSPHLAGSGAAFAKRSLADVELRRRRLASFPLWKLQRLLEDVGCDHDFVTIIESISRFNNNSHKAMPGVWAEKFANLLQACGWPGDRTISSRQYQAVERFRTLLAEIASLDLVAGPVSRSEACRLLRQMAADVEYQPESSGSKVQVLGMLEAGGLDFDCLWILGMHSSALPKSVRPNPFIPRSLQKEKGMPRADAGRELEYAGRIIQRLFNAAPSVVTSWPVTDNGVAQRPSFFINDLPARSLPDTVSAAPAATISAWKGALEYISDFQTRSLLSKKPVSGGTAIVKDQALCPFRAFAHYRLKAQGMEDPDIGLDNMTRGTLVHSTLEFFWETTRTHETLSQLSEEDISSTLSRAVEQALTREEKQKRADMPSRIRELESLRLVRLCRKWLELERKRAPFTVIEQEQLHQETIGRLHFRTRIDRIDRLENGTLAIIDYKTGIPDPKQWYEHRIQEPQLPVYCNAIERSEIGAVLFAVVRNKPAERRFSGLARAPEEFPGLSSHALQKTLNEFGWEDIDQVLGHWKNALPALGDAFTSGDASVDPVDVHKTCRYCDLTSLCRIHERNDWPLWEVRCD